MGGSIGFTFREKNGKEHRMCRWTNIMPWAITNLKIAKKSPAHTKAILKQWYEMVADPTLPMSSCYVPYAGLQPVEYGLILVDQVNNVILDLNGYTSVGTIAAISPLCELNHTNVDGFLKMAKKADSDCGRLYGFFKAGRLNKISAWDDKLDRRVYSEHEFTDIKQVVDFMLNDKYGEFVPDMSPFEVFKFPESTDGVEKLHQKVLELGFVLTPDEEVCWDEFKKRWSDDV